MGFVEPKNVSKTFKNYWIQFQQLPNSGDCSRVEAVSLRDHCLHGG